MDTEHIGRITKRGPPKISTQEYVVATYILVREPNSENCLDLIFAAPPCRKVIIVPDTN